MGVLARAHGLKGEFTVVAHNPESPLWRKGQVFFVVKPELAAQAQDVVLIEGAHSLALQVIRRVPDDRFICGFETIADRTAAEQLEGSHLAVPVASVPASTGDEIYHRELKGFAVVGREGQVLGTVVGVYPGPAQDLVEVAPPSTGRGKPPETWFVPFVEAFILDIDRAQRRLIIDTPEGLLP